MDKKASFMRKSSYLFLFICIACAVLCVCSLVLTLRSHRNYSDCKIRATGTYVTDLKQESESGREYYFAVYKFTYNNASWNYINPIYYRHSGDAPATVTLYHNKFKSQDDLKAYVRFDRSTVVEIVYAIAAFVAFLLFIIFHSAYSDDQKKKVLEENAKKQDINAELDEALSADDLEVQREFMRLKKEQESKNIQ